MYWCKCCRRAMWYICCRWHSVRRSTFHCTRSLRSLPRTLIPSAQARWHYHGHHYIGTWWLRKLCNTRRLLQSFCLRDFQNLRSISWEKWSKHSSRWWGTFSNTRDNIDAEKIARCEASNHIQHRYLSPMYLHRSFKRKLEYFFDFPL